MTELENLVMFLSIIFGVLLGLISSLIDYFFFYHDKSFMALAFTNVPLSEIYIRLAFLFGFTVYGIIISLVMRKRRLAEEALELLAR